MGWWGGGGGAFPLSPCSWQGALGIAPLLLCRKGPRSPALGFVVPARL